MPNFEQFPQSIPSENEKNAEEKNDKLNKEGWFSRRKRKILLGAAAVSAFSSGVEATAAEINQKADEEFSKQNRKNKAELVVDSIGTKLDVETENEDFELRSCSLHQLGFLSAEQFDEEFDQYYERVRSKYPGEGQTDTKSRSLFTKIYLAFLNERIKSATGGESYILTSAEWKMVQKYFDRLSKESPQRTQVAIINQTVTGGEVETTFAVNESKRGDTGDIVTRHYTTNIFRGDMNAEFVLKVEK